MFKHLLLAFLLIAGCSSAAWSEVGRVEASSEDVIATSADGTSRTIGVDDDINAGDTISTPENGWIVLRMVDGASLSLRPNSKLAIGKYDYAEEDIGADQAVFNLLKGALRSITGLIGKRSPSSYRLRTPTATLGIRGTDHETAIVEEQDATPETPSGTYDSVNDGQTILQGDHGDIAIDSGNVGYVHSDRSRRPSLLAARPAFFNKMREAEQRHGIGRVLERLHRRMDNGAFNAHPDLKERLKRDWPNARRANKRANVDMPQNRREKNRERAGQRARQGNDNHNSADGRKHRAMKHKRRD